MSDKIANAARAYEILKGTPLIGSKATDYSKLVERLWDEGMPPGERTGWPSVDKLYTVVPGQFTVVTGWPGSGKSEWLDALILNLAKRGWRFAIFSPENQPTEVHIAKFAEKFIGKPFSAGPTERATKEEVREALVEIAEWFGFLAPTIDTTRDTFSITHILDACEAHFRIAEIWGKSENKRGLIIDPWNEIEHGIPPGMSETLYISQTLTRVRSWARKNGVHVWIVAHPQKLNRERESGKLPIPRPDSISGSQHWWNKADNAITVWRELGDPMNQNVQVHVQKIRFKHVGKAGIADLSYDRVTGRYHEKIGVANYYDSRDDEPYDHQGRLVA